MLIDGNALVHRGFHALPGLTTKDGRASGAVYGFTMILLRAIKDIKPSHIAATFDLAGPTFRHEAYKEYKGTRVKAPQELYDQIPLAKDVVRALGIPTFEKQGYEADDCLGTLAKKIYQEHGDDSEILIVTGDLDTLQLVNGSIKVYTLKKGLSDIMIYDAKAVRERYGLTPEQMIDFKALRGDPSDNIKGVKGIGEKGAIDLIKQFSSLENLYKEIKGKKDISKKIKPRTLELLIVGEASAKQSYDLSKIVCDLDIDASFSAYEFGSKQLAETGKIFRDLEFTSLLNKLPSNYHATVPDGEEVERVQPDIKWKQNYELIDTEAKLEKLLTKIERASELVFDTETTGLNAIIARLVGIALSIKPGEAYYVPAKIVLTSKRLIKLLEQKSLKKIGHNIKYDTLVLENEGIKVAGIYFDTMIASYLLNAGSRQYSLDALAFAEFGYQMQPITDLIGTGKTQITMDQVPVEKVSWYASEDADVTIRLKEVFEPEINKQKLQRVLYDIDMPLIPVLADMERCGVKVDTKFLNKLSGEAEIDIKDLEKKIHKVTGAEFNIASPKQLKEVLFEKMGLVPIENRKTKTGISTAAGELEKMIGQHEVIPLILEYRELTKLQSTYLETLPLLVNSQTARIHTNYNQTIAATGRLSSTDPNLQNIPIKGEGLGSQIRKAFVPEKGWKLLSLDYSQIELRIVAHLARDKNMMRIFKEGDDIHTNTAMAVFGVPADKTTKDMRRDAKTINFGILYGLSSFGLSSRIGEISRVEAKSFIEKYFAAYPQVEQYIEQVKLQVREEGFVRSETGRIRKFPEIRSSNFQIRAAAERAAVNFPIQSLAADVIKVAMINIFKEIQDTSSKLQESEITMSLQVHDELVFEVREDKVETWAKKIKPMMEEAIKLSIPVGVEAKAGDNWGEMDRLDI